MTKNYAELVTQIDKLHVLHEKNQCVWADFFAACKERIAKDPAFGRDYLITAYGGMFNYEEFGVLDNEQDEALRLQTAETVYHLAKELKT